MKKLSFLITILYFNFSLGQVDIVTKEKLVAAFKKERGEYSKNWETCNDNETFFKADTLVFFENNIPHKCRKFISWSFRNSKSFWQGQIELLGCVTSSKILKKEDDYFKVKIVEKENETLLKIYNDKTHFTFIVLDLIYDDLIKKKKIKLVRKK